MSTKNLQRHHKNKPGLLGPSPGQENSPPKLGGLLGDSPIAESNLNSRLSNPVNCNENLGMVGNLINHSTQPLVPTMMPISAPSANRLGNLSHMPTFPMSPTYNPTGQNPQMPVPVDRYPKDAQNSMMPPMPGPGLPPGPGSLPLNSGPMMMPVSLPMSVPAMNFNQPIPITMASGFPGSQIVRVENMMANNNFPKPAMIPPFPNGMVVPPPAQGPPPMGPNPNLSNSLHNHNQNHNNHNNHNPNPHPGHPSNAMIDLVSSPQAKQSRNEGLLGDRPEQTSPSMAILNPAPRNLSKKRGRGGYDKSLNLPASLKIPNDSDKMGQFLVKSLVRVYNAQGAEPSDARTSAILCDRVVYRNAGQTLSQLKVNLNVLLLLSPRVSRAVGRQRDFMLSQNQPPGAAQSWALATLTHGFIISLPTELSPGAIESVLGFVHGNDINLSLQGGSPENFKHLFITARYFELADLCEQLLSVYNGRLRNCALNFDDLKAEAEALPEMRFFTELPTNLSELEAPAPKAGLLDNP